MPCTGIPDSGGFRRSQQTNDLQQLTRQKNDGGRTRGTRRFSSDSRLSSRQATQKDAMNSVRPSITPGSEVCVPQHSDEKGSPGQICSFFCSNKDLGADPNSLSEIDRSARVAFLRKRFAGTIVRAQEKKRLLLSDGREVDLRNYSKEETCRLQYEGKDFKCSSDKERAKRIAAPRLRRKVERKKFRMALDYMHKTVDIDENNDISKVLKMFESTFARHGRSTLEKLGLFLKDDANV